MEIAGGEAQPPAGTARRVDDTLEVVAAKAWVRVPALSCGCAESAVGPT